MTVITVGSVEETRRFYIETLGFDHIRGVVGKDGRFEICALAKNGARMMLARAPEVSLNPEYAASKQPVAIYLEVEDVDHYFGQLNEKEGVNVVERLTTQWRKRSRAGQSGCLVRRLAPGTLAPSVQG